MDDDIFKEIPDRTPHSVDDRTVIDIVGGQEPLRALVDSGDLTEDQYDSLYPIYEPIMPYGTQKARTGDPYDFIMKELTDLRERLIPYEA